MAVRQPVAGEARMATEGDETLLVTGNAGLPAPRLEAP